MGALQRYIRQQFKNRRPKFTSFDLAEEFFGPDATEDQRKSMRRSIDGLYKNAGYRRERGVHGRITYVTLRVLRD